VASQNKLSEKIVANHETAVVETIAPQIQDEQAAVIDTTAQNDTQALPEDIDTSPADKEPEPIGKDVNYQLGQLSSTDFLVQGSAKSDIGEMAFNSELTPGNEVKLSLNLKQADGKDIELIAYFDLAYFRMELDGGNNVLNKEHKQLLKLTSLSLRPAFEQQYRDYDMPEHALMLVQMMEYWSVSPEGFVHEKREIVSQ
jgi:hypothetical protein